MNKHYEHTQIGYLTIAAIGSALLFTISFAITSDFHWVTWIVMLIFGIALLIFATLKATVSDEWLEISLGIGIIRKKFYLKDIESVQGIQYPWYYGWGMRATFRGERIYSVSGLTAVKIVIKTGEKYIIGTDDPDGLAKAVQGQVAQNNPEKP